MHRSPGRGHVVTAWALGRVSVSGDSAALSVERPGERPSGHTHTHVCDDRMLTRGARRRAHFPFAAVVDQKQP